MRRALGGLLRACHPEPVLAVTLITTLLAIAAGRGPRLTVVCAAAVLCGQLAVGWSNDFADADLDRAHQRPDKPIAAGHVGRRSVGVAAGVALLAAIPLSLAAGLAAAFAHFLGLASAFAYNLGLKRTPASALPYIVAFGLLPAFVTLGPPLNRPPALWATCAGALAGAGAHFTQALPDIERDRAWGAGGLPALLGPTAAAIAGSTLLAMAAAVVAAGARAPVLYVALAMTLLLMLATAVSALAGRRRIAFRLTMAAAAIVAVAVALSGAAF